MAPRRRPDGHTEGDRRRITLPDRIGLRRASARRRTRSRVPGEPSQHRRPHRATQRPATPPSPSTPTMDSESCSARRGTWRSVFGPTAPAPLGCITKQTPEGKTKHRVIQDLKRNQVNRATTVPERQVLPTIASHARYLAILGASTLDDDTTQVETLILDFKDASMGVPQPQTRTTVQHLLPRTPHGQTTATSLHRRNPGRLLHHLASARARRKTQTCWPSQIHCRISSLKAMNSSQWISKSKSNRCNSRFMAGIIG